MNILAIFTNHSPSCREQWVGWKDVCEATHPSARCAVQATFKRISPSSVEIHRLCRAGLKFLAVSGIRELSWVWVVRGGD
jgi:hypothetical protein